MQKVCMAFLFCLAVAQSFGQAQKKLSTYLVGQYNKTLYDQTTGNNPWGMGLGLQLFFKNNSRLKPTIDITADAYLEDDKIFRAFTDGTEMVDVNGMVNVFAGISYHPNKSIYVSLVAGPSFVSQQTLMGLKPSLGFYLSKNQQWTAKVRT